MIPFKCKDMEKKEFYRHALPHFQQPGQAYFVTWSLKDALPAKALKRSKPFNSKQYILFRKRSLKIMLFALCRIIFTGYSGYLRKTKRIILFIYKIFYNQ